MYHHYDFFPAFFAFFYTNFVQLTPAWDTALGDQSEQNLFLGLFGFSFLLTGQYIQNKSDSEASKQEVRAYCISATLWCIQTNIGSLLKGYNRRPAQKFRLSSPLGGAIIHEVSQSSSANQIESRSNQGSCLSCFPWTWQTGNRQSFRFFHGPWKDLKTIQNILGEFYYISFTY